MSFRFKQFSIEQKNSPFKVGTDGVLLGAWATVENTINILDIGSGTGLIALMLAQRNKKARIHAVEVNREAFAQADMNINRSAWANRITHFHQDFQTFATATKYRYDLIVSNPPYFNNDKKSGNPAKDTARHDDGLPLHQLIKLAAHLLDKHGKFSLVLPAEAGEKATIIAGQQGLHLTRLTKVKGHPLRPVKRYLMEFEFLQKPLVKEELVIESGKRHDYTDAYRELTKEFYLAF